MRRAELPPRVASLHPRWHSGGRSVPSCDRRSTWPLSAARSNVRTADLRISCTRAPRQPVALQAFAHADQKYLVRSPPRWRHRSPAQAGIHRQGLAGVGGPQRRRTVAAPQTTNGRIACDPAVTPEPAVARIWPFVGHLSCSITDTPAVGRPVGRSQLGRVTLPLPFGCFRPPRRGTYGTPTPSPQRNRTAVPLVPQTGRPASFG